MEGDEVQMKLINETNKLLGFVVAPEDRPLRSGDESQFGIGFLSRCLHSSLFRLNKQKRNQEMK